MKISFVRSLALALTLALPTVALADSKPAEKPATSTPAKKHHKKIIKGTMKPAPAKPTTPAPAPAPAPKK